MRAECLAVGVDRLDYTKGIVERLMAVEQLLEDASLLSASGSRWCRSPRPAAREFPPTRICSKRVDEAVERINQRFQTQRWRPIVLIERQCDHQEVRRWYRAADVCLVTSLHDGMNLVAKEFVAARDDEDGVLVLSKFTGAAGELQDALIVNPYDIDGVAEAIRAGLDMSRDDRPQPHEAHATAGDGAQYLSVGGKRAGRFARAQNRCHGRSRAKLAADCASSRARNPNRSCDAENSLGASAA